LPMKLLASDYRYDRSKVTFHFSAENRVDFRQLVRDLASIFKCRIELHQIGIRDEAKLYPGLGPCGEKLCCQRHLTRFKSVSIRMARLQNLPLNPSKISGNCGRLMCCLNYECETYSELSGLLPKIGEEKDIDGKRCIVVFISPLTETITVQLKDEIGKKSTLTRQEWDSGRTAKSKYKQG
jgi:cell fate regulator YaaT (PSP1 superfamily)